MKPTETRILIVDDAATVRLFERTILEKAGYHVDEAINGIEALEKIELNGPYDLYLVDINMPQMDGYSFLEEMRSLGIEQSPAIMVSTESEKYDKERAYRSGANYYITKPIKPETLLKYIQIFLGIGGTK